MPGGEIQLLSVGKQDKYLIGDPEITFFKSVYRRHSNFSIETKEETFFGNLGFGEKSTCKLHKDGDLISGMMLHIQLGSLNITTQNSTGCGDTEDTVFSWVNSIGHAIFEYIEIEIGGSLIDRHYGEWYEIWMELTQSLDKKMGYYKMIGKKSNAGYSYNSFTKSIELLVPLQFWFCKRFGLALPVLALTEHEIKINVKWRRLSQLWITNKNGQKPKKIPSFKAKLLVDYVFLDIPDKVKFVRKNNYYLIEQLQLEEESFRKTAKTPRIKLHFYHPIKELVWVIQRSDVTTSVKDSDSDGYNDTYGNDWFNFTKSLKWDDNSDFFDSARLTLDRSERFRWLPSSYFRLYQPYKYHSCIPDNLIYTFSFALRAEEYQPTGSCNFSNFENKILELDLRSTPDVEDYTVKIYATNHNILVVSRGQAGLVFSI